MESLFSGVKKKQEDSQEKKIKKLEKEKKSLSDHLDYYRERVKMMGDFEQKLVELMKTIELRREELVELEKKISFKEEFLMKLYEAQKKQKDKEKEEETSVVDDDLKLIESILADKETMEEVEKAEEHHKETLEKVENEVEKYACAICFDEYEVSKIKWLETCDCKFCVDCLQYTVTDWIRNNKLKMSCPNTECKKEFDFDQVRLILDNDELTKKYDQALLERAIDSMEDSVYCINQKCSKICFKPEDSDFVKCEHCNQKFCFKCKKDHDETTTCKDHEQYLKDLGNVDVAMDKYLSKINTNNCPNCKMVTEKIAGCNHITCPKCHTHWCWLCNKKLNASRPYDHFKAGGCTTFDNSKDTYRGGGRADFRHGRYRGGRGYGGYGGYGSDEFSDDDSVYSDGSY